MSLSWDHNAYYHPLLLRQLPPTCERVLDVGCGAGALAAQLAGRAAQVDALDRSPDMIATARLRVPGNVTCLEADILTVALPPSSYDAVTSVSALHHLPLDEALPRLGAALRPGGVLAAVALPLMDLPRELPLELVAHLAHGAHGLRLATARALAGSRASPAFEPSHARMPLREPQLTVREVRGQAEEILPGVRVRRLLFWRYLLVWHKPG